MVNNTSSALNKGILNIKENVSSLVAVDVLLIFVLEKSVLHLHVKKREHFNSGRRPVRDSPVAPV